MNFIIKHLVFTDPFQIAVTTTIIATTHAMNCIHALQAVKNIEHIPFIRDIAAIIIQQLM